MIENKALLLCYMHDWPIENGSYGQVSQESGVPESLKLSCEK